MDAYNPIFHINFAIGKILKGNKMYNNNHFITNNSLCQT